MPSTDEQHNCLMPLQSQDERVGYALASASGTARVLEQENVLFRDLNNSLFWNGLISRWKDSSEDRKQRDI